MQQPCGGIRNRELALKSDIHELQASPLDVIRERQVAPRLPRFVESLGDRPIDAFLLGRPGSLAAPVRINALELCQRVGETSKYV